MPQSLLSIEHVLFNENVYILDCKIQWHCVTWINHDYGHIKYTKSFSLFCMRTSHKGICVEFVLIML